MPTHVALIRGINVGGRNRVAMTDLRAVVTALAHTDVATYIQSGNVVFTSTQTDTTAIAAALEHAIAESLSVRPWPCARPDRLPSQPKVPVNGLSALSDAPGKAAGTWPDLGGV